MLMCELFLLCHFTGCTYFNTLSVEYNPSGRPSFIFPLEQKVSLFLEPVKGNDSLVWYRDGRETWLLNTLPSSLIYEAVSRELNRMGITVIKNSDTSLGRIEIENRWFGPYGNTQFSAALILSMSLYSRGSYSPCWRGRFEGGAFSREAVYTDLDRIFLMEKVASKALTDSVRQLGWDHDFIRLIQALSLKSVFLD